MISHSKCLSLQREILSATNHWIVLQNVRVFVTFSLFPPSLHILSCLTEVLFFSLSKVSVLSSRAACFRWSVHIPLTTFAFQLCPHSMMKKLNGCTASPCCKKEFKKKHYNCVEKRCKSSFTYCFIYCVYQIISENVLRKS